MKSAAKVGVAALTGASTAIVALTKQSVESYAEYEQLVGGVETLFKNSSDAVMSYAENAYKTAGLSANEYMTTVTSFSASLLQSLGGDTEAAAQYADKAITDMSDNANKMGTSMEMIQNAYQGFAKQNYTMLDNLKLGYGGTKEEMQRLLADAEKLSGQKFDLSSYADVIEAIHVVQTEMGITGTTAKEAASTIQGSAGMMKSAWENLVTGFANPDADLTVLLSNFTDSVVTFGQNLIPTIQNTLPNITTGITELINALLPQIPPILQTLLPSVIEGANGLISGFIGILPTLVSTLSTVIAEQGVPLVNSLVGGIVEMLPVIVESGLQLILGLAQGLTESIPELLPTIVQVVSDIATMLAQPDTLTHILMAALDLILALGTGLADSIPQLVSTAVQVIVGLCDFLLDPDNLTELIAVALELIVALAGGLISAIPELLKGVGEIISSITNSFKQTDWGKIGKDLLEGIKNGIKGAWANLKKWFTGLFDDLIGIAKEILGIASPSKVFAEMGMYVDEGLAKGIKDYAHVAVSAAKNLARDVENASKIEPQTYTVTPVIQPAQTSGVLSGVDFNTLAAVSIDGIASIAKAVDYNALADVAAQGVGVLVDLFTSGKAKTNISNARDLRSVSYG